MAELLHEGSFFGKDKIVAYSALKHFDFTEGRVVEALQELRQPWLDQLDQNM